MDCTIPSYNIRAFSHSISTLCRISKELYIEFDPLDGLTLRALNDAKSAFASFHFEPTFFERCTAPADQLTSTAQKKKTKKRKKKQRYHRRKDDDDVEEDEFDRKYICRVPLRIVNAILKPRKGVESLRIRSSGSKNTDECYDDVSSFVSGDVERYDLKLQLCFEFKIQNTGQMRITRRIGVEECDVVTAVAPKEGCSEIIVEARTLSKMLDPLFRTAEVALTVDDSKKTVQATSFHHSDATPSASDNALIGANAVLKTETSMGCHEFEEFAFRDDRIMDDHDMPPAVNEKVTLVFGIKEVKAILQFCSQALADNELNVIISFEWGGRPIIFESDGDTFSAQLIMSTIDYRLLRDDTVIRDGSGSNNSVTRKSVDGSDNTGARVE